MCLPIVIAAQSPVSGLHRIEMNSSIGFCSPKTETIVIQDSEHDTRAFLFAPHDYLCVDFDTVATKILDEADISTLRDFLEDVIVKGRNGCDYSSDSLSQHLDVRIWMKLYLIDGDCEWKDLNYTEFKNFLFKLD